MVFYIYYKYKIAYLSIDGPARAFTEKYINSKIDKKDAL